jgi:hypothetical protein
MASKPIVRASFLYSSSRNWNKVYLIGIEQPVAVANPRIFYCILQMPIVLDMIWYDMMYMIWYNIRYDMIYDMIRYDIWYDMIRYDVWYKIWYMIWYDMIW